QKVSLGPIGSFHVLHTLPLLRYAAGPRAAMMESESAFITTRSSMQVNERSVVVTGAASGIGKAMALRFAREGARAIVLADQQAEKLDPIAEAIGQMGVECLALACDVAQESDIQSLVAQAHARWYKQHRPQAF
ncbi:MAG: SDR family NAD(P)-dependent oxidoreductase, partial [Betaproteobacteria bacterium]|nr:SDR family NAD(P)-dependent oxidoreductase [Betaproteobacteria bacterium]